MRVWWLVLAAVAAASGQTVGVIAVAEGRSLGPRQVQLTVTCYNAGAVFDRDYVAFLHFDRGAGGEQLYDDPLGPRVAATTSSAWAPDEVTVLTFEPVEVPVGLRREVFVKFGIYDPQGGGGRLPLVGCDGSSRVLVGKLVPDGDGCRFVRTAPSSGGEAERIGVRPRAMVRQMAEEPLVRLGNADLAAWRVEGIGAGQAGAVRTREELCWSEASLKLTYHGGAGGDGFVLRPPEPLAVADGADVAYLWLLGRAAAWNRRPTTEEPLLRHWLEFQDGQGETRRVAFPNTVGAPWWYAARVRLPADWPRPLSWTGAGFGGCTNKLPRSLLLDALVVTKEQAAPTLSTTVSLDNLPFPQDPDGLLPDAPAECHNRVEAVDGGWELSCEVGTERLSYRYRPATGTFDDLAVAWQDGDQSQRLRLAAGSGPLLELGGRRYLPQAGVKTSRVASEAVDGGVRTRWRCEAGGAAAEYDLTLRIKARSLLVEVEGRDEGLVGLATGQFEGPPGAHFVPVPYWTWGLWDYGRDGGVVVSGPLFVSGYPDWYRSHASTPTFGSGLSHRIDTLTGGGLDYVPGVDYQTRSDGRRNLLHERYVFTVSPTLREVLPSVPHPPSPNRERLAPLCHSTGGSAAGIDGQLDHWRRLAQYGVTDVYLRHFDGMWADAAQGPQEWTLTTHAAPTAGDVRVRRYLDELRELGFTPVLYTNYTDLQPAAAEFAWDKVARLPNGDISPWCWPGSYPLKPLRAVELEAGYAPRIAQRFGTTGSFCDVHTAVAPWHKLDCDARLPGAAEFGTTYRCYGQLLLNERTAYGAVYSEGSTHWLYAGLADGSDAQIRSPHPHREPLLVDFDLLRIHPLEMDAGMSWLSRYIEPEDEAELGGPEAAQDRFTAATVAFGHQGTFTGRRFRGYETDIRTYYLVRPLQTLYAMRHTQLIQYRDPKSGEMRSTSDAVRSGAYRESQVHVEYEGGLRVWVNGSFTQDWPVTVDGRSHNLPPAGFVAAGPGPTLVYSATGAAGRVDAAVTPEARFVDARGKAQVVEGIDTDGAVLVRPTEGGVQVWPLGRVTRLRLDVAVLGLAEVKQLRALDVDGDLLVETATEVADGWLSLPLDRQAVRFELRR